MCGRFTLIDPEGAVSEFSPDEVECDPGKPRYNIAPSQKVNAIVLRRSRRVMVGFQWGLVPAWTRDPSIGNKLINARAETLTEKPAFKYAFTKTRCLVLADGFYEWDKHGGRNQPMWIRVGGGKPFAFAGLYEIWHPRMSDELRTCTIITTEANELLSGVHERMPVILTGQDCARWIDPGCTDKWKLLNMLKPFDAGEMEAVPVSTHVNSPLHEGRQCIEKVNVKV